MRKTLIVWLLVIALVAAFVSPAAAQKKKKKKGPKPYTSEEVTVQFGHPVFHGPSEGDVVSVTAQEFRRRCALPASNGLDGYVFETPEAYLKIDSEITTESSSSGPLPRDIDIYLFDENCEVTQAWNNEGDEETGIVAKGTAYIFLHNYEAAAGPTKVKFTLTPLK